MSKPGQIVVPDSIRHALRALIAYRMRDAVERVARARAWCRGAYRARNGCRCFLGHVADYDAVGPQDPDAWNIGGGVGALVDWDRFAEAVGTRAAAAAVRAEAERLLA